MARTQTFDQLNNMSTEWFSKMDIPAEAKKKRVDLSMLYAEIFFMFFDYVIMGMLETKEQMVEWLDERLNIVASNYIGKDDLAYVNDWSVKEAEQIADATIKHKDDEPEYWVEPTPEGGTEDVVKTFDFEEFDVSVPQNEYWTSDIRGLLLAIECANSVANYYEIYDALERGMTNKVWITEADDRVRKTHDEVDHTDIPITDLFVVGESYMLFPCDISHGAEEKEVANCRCHLEFYKK